MPHLHIHWLIPPISRNVSTSVWIQSLTIPTSILTRELQNSSNYERRNPTFSFGLTWTSFLFETVTSACRLFSQRGHASHICGALLGILYFSNEVTPHFCLLWGIEAFTGLLKHLMDSLCQNQYDLSSQKSFYSKHFHCGSRDQTFFEGGRGGDRKREKEQAHGSVTTKMSVPNIMLN